MLVVIWLACWKIDKELHGSNKNGLVPKCLCVAAVRPSSFWKYPHLTVFFCCFFSEGLQVIQVFGLKHWSRSCLQRASIVLLKHKYTLNAFQAEVGEWASLGMDRAFLLEHLRGRTDGDCKLRECWVQISVDRQCLLLCSTWGMCYLMGHKTAWRP